MSIILVRHGETAGNAGRVLQRADVPLNERGIRQAAGLAARLAEMGVVHILCSDLTRAKMTAEPLCAKTGLPAEYTPLLQERNFGDLRGIAYSELRENPFGPDFAPPNGEDWSMFHARVADAFALVVKRRRALSGPLVVVTHGLVCRAMLERHADRVSAMRVPERFDNASVTILSEREPYEAALVNCTRHLAKELVATAEGGQV